MEQMCWEERYRFLRFLDFYCLPTDALYELFARRMCEMLLQEGFTQRGEVTPIIIIASAASAAASSSSSSTVPLLDFGAQVLCSHHNGSACRSRDASIWTASGTHPNNTLNPSTFRSVPLTTNVVSSSAHSTLDGDKVDTSMCGDHHHAAAATAATVAVVASKKRLREPTHNSTSSSSSSSSSSSLRADGTEEKREEEKEKETSETFMTKRHKLDAASCATAIHALDEDDAMATEATATEEAAAAVMTSSPSPSSRWPSFDASLFSGDCQQIDVHIGSVHAHTTLFHLLPPAEYWFMLQIANACGFEPCSYAPLFALNDSGEMMFHAAYISFLHQLPRSNWMEWQWIDMLSRPLIRAGHIRATLFHLYPVDDINGTATTLTSTTATATREIVRCMRPVIGSGNIRANITKENDMKVEENDKEHIMPANERNWMALSTMWPLIDKLDGILAFQESEQAVFGALQNSLEFDNVVEPTTLWLCQTFNPDPVTDAEGFADAHLVLAGGLVSRILQSDAVNRVLREHHYPFDFHSDMDGFIVGRCAFAKQRLAQRLLTYCESKRLESAKGAAEAAEEGGNGADHLSDVEPKKPTEEHLPIAGLIPGIIILLVPHCKRLVQIILSDAVDAAALVYNFDFSFLQCAVEKGRVVVTPQFMMDQIQGTATPNKLYGPTQTHFRDTRVIKALDKGFFVPSKLRNQQHPKSFWERVENSSAVTQYKRDLQTGRHRYFHWRPMMATARTITPTPTATAIATRADGRCHATSIALHREERQHLFHVMSHLTVHESLAACFRFYDDIARDPAFASIYLRAFSCQWAHPYFLTQTETCVLSSASSPSDERSSPMDLYMSASSPVHTDLLVRHVDAMSLAGNWKHNARESRPRMFALSHPMYIDIEHALLYAHPKTKRVYLIFPRSNIHQHVLQMLRAIWSSVMRVVEKHASPGQCIYSTFDSHLVNIEVAGFKATQALDCVSFKDIEARMQPGECRRVQALLTFQNLLMVPTTPHVSFFFPTEAAAATTTTTATTTGSCRLVPQLVCDKYRLFQGYTIQGEL